MAALESMSLFEEQRIHLLMCPSPLQASLQSVSNRRERERERLRKRFELMCVGETFLLGGLDCAWPSSCFTLHVVYGDLS